MKEAKVIPLHCYHCDVISLFQIADNYLLAPGFKEALDNYYPKASNEDKLKCLELLTALELSDVINESGEKQQAQSTQTARYERTENVKPRPPSADRPSTANSHARRRPKSAMATARECLRYVTLVFLKVTVLYSDCSHTCWTTARFIMALHDQLRPELSGQEERGGGLRQVRKRA